MVTPLITLYQVLRDTDSPWQVSLVVCMQDVIMMTRGNGMVNDSVAFQFGCLRLNYHGTTLVNNMHRNTYIVCALTPVSMVPSWPMHQPVRCRAICRALCLWQIYPT